MDTHSRTADCRRELFTAHAALCGAERAVCHAVMNEVSSDGCLRVLKEAGLQTAVIESLLQAVQKHLERRAGGMRIGALLFSLEAGFLGGTEEAERMLSEWRQEL
jgi:cobalt-precorrin-5B (C1)-methyltransferase